MTFGALRRQANSRWWNPETTAARARLFRFGLLLVPIVLILVRMPYAATSMDLARDVFTAQRILQGVAYPLVGPVFGGIFHLGPLWDYLLAALLLVSGGNWLVLIELIGLLIALQVPLAYLLGKALGDRRTGLLWACLLVSPSWDTFQSLLPSHPSLVTPLVLAFLLCAIRQWRRPSTAYAIGMASTFVLALHAHPSSIALTWIAIPVLIRSWRRGDLRGCVVASLAGIVLLPIVPFLLWDATHGFADAHAIGGYAATLDPAAALTRSWSLLPAVAAGGGMYWFATVLRWSTTMSGLVMTALALCGLFIGIGAFRARHDRQRTRTLGIAIALLIFATLFTAVLRDITPFYMTSPLHVAVCGVAALALSALGATSAAQIMRAAAICIALTLGLAVDVGSARVQTQGAWPFAWWPIMDVKRAVAAPTPLMMLPAYAMPASGRFLCGQSDASIHGAYASQLLQDYAIEMRLACARSDVQFGGNDPDRPHWLGMSRALFAQLDVEPTMRLGSVGLVRAQPLAIGQAIAPPTEPRYPAYVPQVGAERQRHLSVELAAHQHLVISNLAFMLGGTHRIEASMNGQPIAPLAFDSVSNVYACTECNANEAATLDLTLHSTNLGDLDLVVF